MGGVTDCGFCITALDPETAGCMMLESFIHDCYIAIRARKT